MKPQLDEIKEALSKSTHGEEWTNFDDRKHSKIVYEYDRLTESTCDIIAECKTVEMAQFIANTPQWIAFLLEENEGLSEHVDVWETESFRANDEIQQLREELEHVNKRLDEEIRTASMQREVIRHAGGELESLRSELAAKDKALEAMQKTFEWAARIIDSGMYGGTLRYEPRDWFVKYHETLQQVKGDA